MPPMNRCTRFFCIVVAVAGLGVAGGCVVKVKPRPGHPHHRTVVKVKRDNGKHKGEDKGKHKGKKKHGEGDDPDAGRRRAGNR